MKKTIDRNLLKYAAGNSIFCPKCSDIADYRRWVMLYTPVERLVFNGCLSCWNKHLAVINEKSHVVVDDAYLIENGFEVIRNTPAKKVKKC